VRLEYGEKADGMEIKVENYLKERFGSKTTLNSMERLGEGAHGIAYLVKFTTRSGEQRLIMKPLFPLKIVITDFSEDNTTSFETLNLEPIRLNGKHHSR
jgi:hypothetical protein